MLLDLFHKRRKREREGVADVYVYNEMPNSLRVQIVHIMSDGIEAEYGPDQQSNGAYKFLHDSLAREFGVFHLTDDAQGAYPDYRTALYNFFLHERDIERALSVVELVFRYMLVVAQRRDVVEHRRVGAAAAIEELNDRFRENGVGFQFETGQIIRIDSQIIHQEAIKPTLALLSESGFEGANEEFLRAHEHYRLGRFKEALNDALKSLESTMKTICLARNWRVESNATANKLLDACFTNGLLSPHLQAHFAGLRSTLEAGVPPLRNKMSAHGQGLSRQEIPRHIVAYGLNITASGIRLLVESHMAG